MGISQKNKIKFKWIPIAMLYLETSLTYHQIYNILTHHKTSIRVSIN